MTGGTIQCGGLMPPKQKAVVGDVDGVPYSHNLSSGLVVVGSGLVSNDRRDTFKIKADSTLEAQVSWCIRSNP